MKRALLLLAMYASFGILAPAASAHGHSHPHRRGHQHHHHVHHGVVAHRALVDQESEEWAWYFKEPTPEEREWEQLHPAEVGPEEDSPEPEWEVTIEAG